MIATATPCVIIEMGQINDSIHDNVTQSYFLILLGFFAQFEENWGNSSGPVSFPLFGSGTFDSNSTSFGVRVKSHFPSIRGRRHRPKCDELR